MRERRRMKMPRALARVVPGYQEAMIVLTACRLRVFEALAGESREGPRIAAELHLEPRGTEVLLNALTAMRLLAKRGDAFALTAAASRYLEPGEPDYLGGLYRHQERMWHHWSSLADALREGPAGEEDPRADAEEFLLAMEANARRSGPAVADAVNLRGVRRLLDVGGGPGTWARLFLERRPSLDITVLDRPEAVAAVRRLGLHREHRGAIRFRAGDFLARSLGRGYDLVWASHVVHALDPAGVRTLLERCRRSLLPGGRLLIHDFFLDDRGVRPRRAAVMSVHMLAVTGSGRCYRLREMLELMEESGFTRVRRAAVFAATALVEGRRA